MGHASVNFFAVGYEKLEDTRIAKFIKDSTAYSDITKDVLNGEEHDTWDEEMQRKFDEALLDPHPDSDEELESEPESDDEDVPGDISIRGILYPEDESDASDEEDGSRDFGEQEPEDDLEGREENEELSEIEEEQMDNYMDLGVDTDYESDE
ncbi:hypothetical protein B0H10DRAFT_1966650 [Mycena sp. CBHHK59/15]|nr:hypothetical protein B0H10DRAFT_1966650 [Mycena sp. CBHHK59/15]